MSADFYKSFQIMNLPLKFVIFEKAAKFKIVCKLKVAL